MKKRFLCLACAAVLGSACEETTSGIPAVSGFAIEHYLGKWYEIARLPNNFEKNMTQVTAVYTVGDDGTVQVVNQGYRNGIASTAEGTVRSADNMEGTGELEVTFFWPFYSPYRIIRLAPDYTTSVVTGADKRYLWILSRDPYLPQSEENDIMDFLITNGYRVEDLIYSWDDKDPGN